MPAPDKHVPGKVAFIFDALAWKDRELELVLLTPSSIGVNDGPTLSAVEVERIRNKDATEAVGEFWRALTVEEERGVMDTETDPLVKNDGAEVLEKIVLINPEVLPGTTSHTIVTLVRSRVGKMVVFWHVSINWIVVFAWLGMIRSLLYVWYSEKRSAMSIEKTTIPP
jgi:hypothetical protein